MFTTFSGPKNDFIYLVISFRKARSVITKLIYVEVWKELLFRAVSLMTV